MNETCPRCGRALHPLEKLYVLVRDAHDAIERIQQAERAEDLSRVRDSTEEAASSTDRLRRELRCRAGRCA